jgi:hypothetical protein
MLHIPHIPDEAGWHGYESDLDVRDLHGLFFGKSIEEVQKHFGNGRSIGRMDELLFAPRPVFQYYVHAFALFLRSERAAGDPDSASPFLSLLEAREERDPGSVRNILPLLESSLDFVAENQNHFDASIEIYGDFQERVQCIRQMCGA